MGILIPILATILIMSIPFLYEFIAKKTNPNYETYSEFLAKMTDEERVAYSKAIRKYKNNPKHRSMSPFSSMHKRVKPNYRRK